MSAEKQICTSANNRQGNLDTVDAFCSNLLHPPWLELKWGATAKLWTKLDFVHFEKLSFLSLPRSQTETRLFQISSGWSDSKESLETIWYGRVSFTQGFQRLDKVELRGCLKSQVLMALATEVAAIWTQSALADCEPLPFYSPRWRALFTS